MLSKNTSYIERLDHLRFFAASLVLILHSFLLLRPPNSHAWFVFPLFEQGHVGVQLFMVISGFILGVISQKAELQPAKFYLNRVLRIYPLFLVVLCLGYFANPDLFAPSNAIKFLIALLPFSNISRLNYGEFGGHLWSIAVELQFYLLFPALKRFLDLNGVGYFFTLGLFVIVLRTLVFVLHGSVHFLSYFTIFGAIDLFMIGLLLGNFYNKDGHLFAHPLWFCSSFFCLNALIMIAFGGKSFFHVASAHAYIFAGGQSGHWLWIIWPDILGGLFALMILSYLQMRSHIPLSNLLGKMGKYSYSMYLWNILIIDCVAKFVKIDNVLLYALTIFFILPVTVLFAGVSYHVIERPFLAWRMTYTTKAEHP